MLMGLMSWSPEYSVNVREIDEQHKVLIKMINDLHDAMLKKQGKDVLGKILTDMAVYAQKHFATEEMYMKRYKYPDFTAHHGEHAAFIDKVTKFKSDFDANRLGLSIEVMNFLSEWLKNHIMGVDKKFGPFFNSKGLT